MSLGDRGGPGTLDRFYHFGEYFKLQALVWRLCLAIGAPGIGFCSLIYMHAYCTWLLRIHNSCHGIAFVLWNSLGNAGEWNYPRESTRPSCHGSHWLWWRNIQIPVGHGLAGDRHLGYFPVLGSLPPRACARGRLSPALQCGHFGLDPSLFGGLSLAWGDVERHACSSPTRCQ